MKILFDLDETLYLGDVIKVARERLISENLVLPPYSGADAKDFTFSNFPEILRDKIYELIKDPNVAAIDKKPIFGAYTFIYYLKKVLNCKIGILTARPLQLHEPTKYCLWRDFPGIEWDLIGFANNTNEHSPSISKKSILESWMPDYYFDDYLGFCGEAAKAGVQNVFLIRNKHTGWNLNKPICNAIIKPIKSILEFNVNEL